MLQWSHVHSNVETISSACRPIRCAKCFNGATFTRTWKLVGCSAGGQKSSRFNGATFTRTWKLERQAWQCGRLIGFNGATFTRTWKRAESWSLKSPFWCFNGATFTRTWKLAEVVRRVKKAEGLQWSHVHSNVETGKDARASGLQAGFNGATFTRTWKRRRLVASVRAIEPASMEPRSLERGNSSTARELKSDYSRFNGATFTRTWKRRPALAATCECGRRLQWSHVHSNVETQRRAIPTSLMRMLQWSHVHSNVETCDLDITSDE